MKPWRTVQLLAAGLAVAWLTGAAGPAGAQEAARKPNILFIMGDDIGWMQPSIVRPYVRSW